MARILVVAALSLLLLSEAVKAEKTESYVFLEITKNPSWEPSINNDGEIVYLANDSAGNPNVFSTRRGQVTWSTTGLLRFPRINAAGEVVYADRTAPTPYFQVWSTGPSGAAPLFRGNLPSIGDNGEICFSITAAGWSSIRSNHRGQVVRLKAKTSSSCDVNNNGELVYRDRDESGQFQIYSSSRNRLTDLADHLMGSPAINNSGEVIYVASGELYTHSGGRLTSTRSDVGFYVDINDRGDIVFPLRKKREFRIVLATTSPEMYPRYRNLNLVDARSAGPDVSVRVGFVLPETQEGAGSRSKYFQAIVFSTSGSDQEYPKFDATEVEELSVRLGPKEAKISVRSMAERRDVDGDGNDDLILQIMTKMTGLRCKSRGASLFGFTKSGQYFSGRAQFDGSFCGPSGKISPVPDRRN